MAFKTRAFELFYKRLGITGSNNGVVNYTGYLSESWFTSSNLVGSTRVSHSFLNFPDDGPGYTYVSTRDLAYNVKYKAIPWSSHACDMLWNVAVPSWSYYDSSSTQFDGDTNRTVVDRFWSASFVTKSFYRNYYDTTNYGLPTYNITSSWRIIDPKLISASFRHVHSVDGGSAYPTFVGSRVSTAQPDSSSFVAYDMTYPTSSVESTSSFDGRFFDGSGGAGITRTAISRSLVTMSLYANDDTTTGRRLMSEALKSRRLYFPTSVTQSGQTTGTDYWFKRFTGYKETDIFTENGGIYNVQLTLKRSIANDYYPNDGTYLSVFLFNVRNTIPATANRNLGTAGWYPPDNNIVKIGNSYEGGPALSFVDPQTGFLVEKFSFNVIQYGYPAQLCIEPTGSLLTDSYFGIIVDDIQICKIGVTTDPRFIQPTSVATNTSNRSSAEEGGGGGPIGEE